MLEVNLCGLKITSPLILASGILGVSYSTMIRLFNSGLGAITTKSIGPIPRRGYRNPSIVEITPGTFLNSVGLANPGIDYFISEIKEIKSHNIPLIVSIFGDSNKSYLDVAFKAEKAGADAVELNISCPHAEVSSIGIDKKLTYSLVNLLKQNLKIPIFVKLNPNVTNLIDIALAAENGGADAVIAINTISAMKIDINTRCPLLSHGTGGLSGKAVHPIAVKHVYDLYKILKIPIIGCGGVDSWQDVVEFFLAGASAVQIGTALHKDISIIKNINSGISTYLKLNKVKSIMDIIGFAHQFETQEVSECD